MPAQKKVPQTDAIFARLHEVNPQADQADNVLRLSLDAKAAVKIGWCPSNVAKLQNA